MDLDTNKLTLGRIVWADLPDSNGEPCGNHRFIIVSAPTSFDDEEIVALVGVSTRIPDKDEEAECVPLRYHQQGHALTKLKKPSWAHCRWYQEAKLGQIQELSGQVGQAAVENILAAIAALKKK